MSLKVIIVDDDGVVIFLHKMVAATSGLSLDPLHFYNGNSVFIYLDKLANKVDDDFLILLDINMPEMNGWEFLEAIQDMPYANKIKIILVTSSLDRNDQLKSIQYPLVIDYVQKPLGMETCKRIMKLPQISSFFKSIE